MQGQELGRVRKRTRIGTGIWTVTAAETVTGMETGLKTRSGAVKGLHGTGQENDRDKVRDRNCNRGRDRKR
jgi:hypothetical protein